MIPSSAADKVKPFRLFKYFTYTSIIVLFIGTLILTTINSHWARKMQLKKSKAFALLMIENLNHQIFLQFFIPVSLKYQAISLRNQEQYELMDRVVKSTLHSFKVDNVTIYDSKKNIVSYSFNRTLIGREDVGGKDYVDAVAGLSSSKIIQTGNFFQILFGFPKEIKLISFAALRREQGVPGQEGEIYGVIEIVQNLSKDHETIFNFQILVIITSTLVMSVLFVVLIFIVKRGEDIIQNRAIERMKLKEQLNRAERLSALGEMTAGISHEIRNPLGIISSSAELLKKKLTAVDPSNSIPDIIVEESARLNNIITDFINFARPRDLNIQPCRVNEILEKNITFLAPQLEEKNCRITTSYGKKIPESMADSDMLYQAFLNILINAMQAMPKGGKIHVKLIANDHNITIVFQDSGQGIPKDVMQKIWDPFFTTKEKGTGLGLGIVKNIIESHNGSILVENSGHTGARVTITLPTG